MGACGITALATPSGEQPADWALNKAKGLGVDITAVALTAGITSGLKAAVNRSRPTGSGQSFPSGHASNTSVCDTLSTRKIDFISMPEEARLGLKIGFTALTVITAWAWVEAKQHYPSNVLGGMALGHFIGAFINDAFLGTEPHKNFLF
jgi:membrane-associated phospholipid phosphatase